MTIKPRRSMLFMPASNARALEKGRTLPADGLIFDLEDSVAQDQKEAARRALVEALSSRAYGSRSLIVRVNGLDTPWGAEDVAALANCGADALLFTKVACAQDVLDATLAMDDADSPLNTRLWVMMETARGVLNAAEIADRANLTPWLLQCVLAARAHGLDAFDSVYNHFTDAAGFAAECAHGRALGFDGKTLIHPTQIEACNAAFGPSAEEIAWARAVIAAFKAPESEGKGAIALQGAMIERLHLEGAMRIMAIADAPGHGAT